MKPWWKGLSVRSANVINNHFSPTWCRKDVTPYDFSNATQDEAKAFLLDQITNEGLKIKRMRNAGAVTEKEILNWLGLIQDRMKMSEKVKQAAEESMAREQIDGGSLYTSGFTAGAAWAFQHIRLKDKLQQERIQAFHAGYQSNKEGKKT